MSGKVKCTCGWSWDKKDSSKKDMYVCHECGKDNSMKNGGWLSKYAEDGVEAKKKPESLLNLTDLTYTPMELNFLNDVKNGYCPTGNCLESSRKAYDMTAGRIKGISGSNDIWTKDLNLISTPGRPSEKQVQENPYFKGDIKSGSADSWDIHGAIVKAGGKNIYSGASKQIVPTDIPTGAVAGWGPAATKGTTHKERGQGMNTKFGLQPSHHSTESVGYDDNGKAIFYDSYTRKYGTLEEIGKELKSKLGYELENISVPKSVAGNTRENLNKKGILKNELTPFSANVDKLLSATKQPWAQINEDGKSRSPNADKEKLSKFAQSLTDNKGELISSLGLSNADYDRLANSALAIAMTESEGGGALGFSDRFGNTKGMTQLNIDNIKKDDRLKTALSKKYKGDGAIWNIQDPYNSAIATMMYLSVADKDAKRLYNKGLTPGIKTVNQPGLIENFRSTNSKLNKDGLFIDELNKRVPYSEIPGYEDGDTTKVNNYLKQLTKSDRYSFVNKDGDLSLKLKTKGNNPKLTDVEKIAYMWQSPNSLKTGDAEGKSQYVNKIKNYYDALTKFNDGGPIQPNYNDADAFYSEDYVGAGYDIIGRNYSPAWGGQFAMGGSLPGSVGFSYARTKGIPSNGPYAKKTKASAQDGKEISYDQWKKQYKLKETPDYNLKRAWELGYTPDKTGHLPTVDNQTGQFLKSKGHPTLKLELDWYNSPEGAEFKSKNTLDSTGKFFKYIPKLQNGKEMQFYQNGLDWKPKSISRDGSVIEDDRGQWDHPGEITKINSNEITMQGVDYPVLGVSDTGDTQMMQPGEDYTYDGNSVTEYPMMKDGGWLSKYDLPKAQTGEKLDFKALMNPGITQSSTKVAMPKDQPKAAIQLNKYKSQQATKEKERLRKLDLAKKGQSDLSNLAADIGTTALTLPTQFRTPTQEELEAGRSGNWSERVPIMSDAVAWGLGNELLGGAMGYAAKNAGPFLNAAKRAIGTESGLLSNTYKLNPWAERLNNANNSYRVAGLDALEDFQKTGILTSRNTAPPTLIEGTDFMLPPRPTSFPSFQKGYADLNYLPKEGGAIFETKLPTFKRGEINPVTGFPIKGRHYAHRVIDPKTGNALGGIPASDIRAFGDKPHWLEGFKEVPKPTSAIENVSSGVFSNLPKLTPEQLQDAKGFLPRRQFVKNLQSEGLIGKDFNFNDLNYAARSSDKTDALTKLALERRHTAFRNVRGTLPTGGVGQQNYTGHSYDMNKPAWGQEISEFENMKKAGVDFNNPKSVAEYQATYIPLEDYGYRATGEHPSNEYGYLFRSSSPTGSTEYGNFQFKSQPNLDFTSGNSQDWFNKYYADLDYHLRPFDKYNYKPRNSKVDDLSKTVMWKKSTEPSIGNATLVGPRGSKAFEIDKEFPFQNLKDLDTKQLENLKQYQKEYRNQYDTGWRGQYKNGGWLNKYN